ncbi:MAG: GTP-binding protein, partial [Nitrospirae bacterium]|nr:GTP-binding protein [Nitrospirota bacterium]
MANLDVNKIRNVAVIAHGGAGKTSLTEAMLFNSGSIDRLGRIEEGNTTTDCEPEEISRKITITSAFGFCNWDGHRINLIDTPGFINFVEDTRGSLKAVDGAVVIVSALSGVKAETEKVWKYACEYEIPRIVFINKMDKESANFPGALDELVQSFGTEGVPLQIPIGSGETFSGIINLINMKAYKFSGGKAAESDIPSDMLSEAQEYRKKLVEKIAESEDALLEKYLEGGELTQEEIIRGIKEGSLSRRFIPVVCGSATKNIGIPQLMDAIMLCLPSLHDLVRIFPIKGKNPKDSKDAQRKPDEKEPFSAYVFKTIADPYAGKLSVFRVYSGALKADSTVLNATSGAKERIGQIFYLLGKKQIPA